MSASGLAKGGAIVAILASQPVYGQSPPDPVAREAQRIQEREQERQRAREEQFRLGQEAPPSGVEAVTDALTEDKGKQCVAIRVVSIVGMSRYKSTEFATELSKIKGDCVAINDINTVLRAITNRYVTDGYVTSRAVVGPQNLQDGALEVIVVEGQLTRITSPKGVYRKRELGAAFAGARGKQLNLRRVEQGVDQLSRLPSWEPDIDIEPGTEPGTSNLVVNRKRGDGIIRPSVSFDNEGSASTGRWQSTMSLDADNVIGVADFWSLYYSRDLNGRANQGSEGVGGSLSLPLGWWTISASGGRYTYESVLAGNGQAFSNNGVSWNGALTVDRMIFRNSKTKFSMSAVLALIDTENRIQGIRLSTSSYRQVTGTFGVRVQRKMLGGLVGVDLGIARGFKIFGANAANTGPGGAIITALRVTGGLSYYTKLQSFGIPLDYTVLVRGQAALDPVFSSGRFSLGGSSTVRGFRDDGISGRYGLFMRHQVSFPLFRLFANEKKLETRFSGFVGYDAGGVIVHNSDRFERGFMHSSTLGVRVQHRHLQAEISVSAPWSAPDFVTHRRAEVSASVRLML